jgi:hypothetical protein
MRIWIGRAIVVLACLVIVAVIAMPSLLRAVSLPHSSTRLAKAEKGLRYMGQALHMYERTHGGKRPASLSTIRKYVEGRPSSAEKPPEDIWDVPYLYSPRGSGPVLLVYLHYCCGGDVVLWLDERKQVRAARAWLFPKWNLTALRE